MPMRHLDASLVGRVATTTALTWELPYDYWEREGRWPRRCRAGIPAVRQRCGGGSTVPCRPQPASADGVVKRVVLPPGGPGVPMGTMPLGISFFLLAAWFLRGPAGLPERLG